VDDEENAISLVENEMMLSMEIMGMIPLMIIQEMAFSKANLDLI